MPEGVALFALIKVANNPWLRGCDPRLTLNTGPFCGRSKIRCTATATALESVWRYRNSIGDQRRICPICVALKPNLTQTF